MRLLLFPGLGADMRLFLPQLKAFHDSLTPAWIDPIEEDGFDLRAYVKRYAASLIESGAVPSEASDGVDRTDGGTDPGDDWAMVGFSFGGQVVMELARLFAAGDDSVSGVAKPRGVVLIAAHRTSDSIKDEFREQVRRGRRAPNWVIRPMLVHYLAPRFAKANGLDGEWKKRLKEMGGDADPSFLKWAGQAAARWTFTESDASRIAEAGISVHQLHGARDDVIPKVDQHVDEVIDGPHLLTWTNAEEVNAFIERTLGVRAGV